MAHDYDRPPAPGERIERTEVVEHTTTDDPHTTRRAAPMWVWLLPLVVAAIVLAWYVFTQGEPNPPSLGGLEVQAPEVVDVDEEPDPIIVVPRIEREDPPVGTQESAPASARTPSAEPVEPAAEQAVTPSEP